MKENGEELPSNAIPPLLSLYWSWFLLQGPNALYVEYLSLKAVLTCPIVHIELPLAPKIVLDLDGELQASDGRQQKGKGRGDREV